MLLDELMDPQELERMIADGYVRRQTHPARPLSILNYSEKAQWEREWNEVTRNCRGLIVDAAGGIVARPFPKFFNHGEPGAPDLSRGQVRVFDKMDGSLGILYPAPVVKVVGVDLGREDDAYAMRTFANYSVATRGSFQSDQAVWATQHFVKNYGGDAPVIGGRTYLFEIIYPQNRIVVDYRGREDLVLLAVLVNGTGMLDEAAFECWPGPKVEEFKYDSVMQVLEQPPRENAEGYVIYHVDSNDRVKVKHDEYVRLHKLVTGVTARTVWELLSQAHSLDEILTNVPDEFQDWVFNTAEGLKVAHEVMWQEIQDEFNRTATSVGYSAHSKDREYRKQFADAAKRCNHTAAVFMFLDGNLDKVDRYIWQRIKPSADKPYNNTLMEAP